MPYIKTLGKVNAPCSRDLARSYHTNHAEVFSVLVRNYFILPFSYRKMVDFELSGEK